MSVKIDEKMIDHLAHLARLEFNAEEKAEIMKDMNRMLAFVDALNKLDTNNVEPLVYISEETNVLRDDDAKTGITQKEALLNAPKKDSDYFKVPKVVEKKQATGD